MVDKILTKMESMRASKMQSNQQRFNNPSDRKDYLKWAKAIPPSRCIHYELDELNGCVVIHLQTRLGPVSLVRDVSPFDLRQIDSSPLLFVTTRAVYDIAHYKNWRGYVADIIREMRVCQSKYIKNQDEVVRP